jgi:stage II sporulation protein D
VTRARSILAVAATLISVLVLAAPAGAAGAVAVTTTGAGLYVTGAGFGHGVGMSQYGAAGYALHGSTYQQILQRYYAQTTLANVNPNRSVTVLLKAKGAAAFAGATVIKGSATKLSSATDYSVLASGPKLKLISGGRTIGIFDSPLQVSGPAPLKLIGTGTYRGSLVFRASTGGGVMTVNSLGLDSYVRGVVPVEMPSSWPQQALDAQAVAARTYAIAAGVGNPAFSLYADTRSQMYEGVTAETPSTNAAVAATRGLVVDYDNAPVVTYFFASSGGETESVQNVWGSLTPEAWLVSEPDPYDTAENNPYHHWNMDLKLNTADSKLGKLVDGSLEGINVVKRGVSPRVIQAQVVGSEGSTTVSGATLQSDLGTPSTWMSFTTVSAQGIRTTSTVAAAATPPAASTPAMANPSAISTATTATPAPPPSGGVALLRGHLLAGQTYAVTGTIFPAAPGTTVTAQFQTGHHWKTVGSGAQDTGGSYSVTVPAAGIYRVLYSGIVGPSVKVR